MATDRISELHRGFRSRYLDYDELTTQVRAWARAFPELVRLDSVGKTDEGRALWVLTIGPDPDRVRPAVWIDGNMHAAELCGSSTALAIAEDVLRLHVDNTYSDHGLQPHVVDSLRDVLFYVMPRMSPDGAEHVLTTGKYVRSSPRDMRPNRNHAHWVSKDVDGDGLALAMRQEDPTGEFVACPEFPDLLLMRRLEDEGPFYKLYPEGEIENFDGHTIPNPHFLSDNETDLNRNFPYSWAPHHMQEGAGSFPASEPESRAVVEFTSAHPHIFAWLNLHTFGGVLIRPLGDKPDNKMDQSDLALYRQVEAWTEEHTGYPSVSGFEEFTYEPDTPLHGDLTDYAYHQRGCVAYVIELWDLFRQIGIERKHPFVDHYSTITRDQNIALARWDQQHNAGRVVRPWNKLTHPQLGEVEVGGIDPRVGLTNPPYERLDEVCRGQTAAFLRLAATAPQLHLTGIKAEAVGPELTRLWLTVENRGYLPTNVLSSAKKLDFNEPLYADISTSGCELHNAGDAHIEVGHLDGWGRGLQDGTDALYFMRSRGNTGARTVLVLIAGKGTARIRVGSCRTGWIEASVAI